VWTSSPWSRPLTLAGLIVLALAAPGCGREDPRGPLRHITGRLEAPEGLDLEHCTVVASRADRMILDGTTRLTGSAFDVAVRGDGPVDLQAARVQATIHLGDDPGKLDAAVANLVREAATVDRAVYSLGEHEGHVREVQPGTTDVVIRIAPRQLGSVRARALALDGAPLADAEVSLTSMADWIHAKTTADGRVLVQDVPTRSWTLEFQPPPSAWPHAVYGRATVTPGMPELDVRLRPSVVVRVRVPTVPPSTAFLTYGDARTTTIWTVGWRAGPDGTMDIAADPDWPEVHVRLERVARQDASGWDSEILAQGTVAVAPGALVELDPAE